MASKRGNPVEERARSITLNQGEVNPVGNATNTDKGSSPARLRGGVRQNPSKVLNQKVTNPSVGKARGGADVVKK